jgi:hypothetical protein
MTLTLVCDSNTSWTALTTSDINAFLHILFLRILTEYVKRQSYPYYVLNGQLQLCCCHTGLLTTVLCLCNLHPTTCSGLSNLVRKPWAILEHFLVFSSATSFHTSFSNSSCSHFHTHWLHGQTAVWRQVQYLSMADYPTMPIVTLTVQKGGKEQG